LDHILNNLKKRKTVLVSTLEEYYKNGLLQKQTHPTKDLTIWNYTPKVQYERLWDEITMQCRGLVTNSKGNVIARPFKKFFNYEELKPEDIPNEYYDVYEKMDGSLGIIFWYGNECNVATRGSFTSPQALRAKQILQKYNFDALDKEYTLLVEIIYPENRIVVDYKGQEELVILAMRSMHTGIDVPYDQLPTEIGMPIVKLYKDWKTGWEDLKKDVSNNDEGFVIHFRNGFRMKIKGDEYKRLHKILTNISNRDIWEYLKDGKPLDEILDKVPDEFYSWVKETKEHFLHQYKTIEDDYVRTYKTLIDINGIVERKLFAQYALSYRHSELLFAMLDNKDYSKLIWRLLYPNYSKPFKRDEN
jgi:RNA ligase